MLPKAVGRRKKRSIHKKISRTITRIRKGIKNIINFHQYNVINGLQLIFKKGKDVHQSINSFASDSLKDIDNRLNRQHDDTSDEFKEEMKDTSTNILVDYCFGEIFGKNYGIRTFLEYEEECEEGLTCAQDINSNTDEDDSVDIDRFFHASGIIIYI